MHVYDSRFPTTAGARLSPPDASLDQYRQLQRAIGTQRVVCVTPSTYGTDNRCLLETLSELGDQARGVAVIDEGIGDGELHRLHACGVRGIRMNLSLGVSSRPEMIRPLAERIAPLGWHMQLITPQDRLLQLAPLLRDLPVPLVLDHLAKIPPSRCGEPAHAFVLELLRAGGCWIKLSGAYLLSEIASPSCEDVRSLARSYLETAPDKLVWGSNWPHATASAGLHPWPDDAVLLDSIADWCNDPDTFEKVLVDNPAELYGFDRV
jgi:predicted TIM-barrel fold metal-dependent hydrolase